MKKIILLFFVLSTALLGVNKIFAYNVAQSITFARGEVVIQAKSGISWSLTSKNATFTGTFMGPIGPLGTYPIYYCRNQYNTICVLILNGTTSTNQVVVDTIPINFDSYSGVWLKPTAKGLQPCNTANVILKNFKVEGTVNFGLPGDSVGVDIYTGGSILNVFSNIYIQEQSGAIVTNVVSNPVLIWANSFAKAFFVLTDTLQINKNYSVKGTANCYNLPPLPNIGITMSIEVYRKISGFIWNPAQCTPNDVILLDVNNIPLAIDSTQLTEPYVSNITLDTLQNVVIMNPTEGEIKFFLGTVEINLPKEFILELFDYQGRQILLEDKKSLPPYLFEGIYLLKMKNGNGKSRFIKLIKK